MKIDAKNAVDEATRKIALGEFKARVKNEYEGIVSQYKEVIRALDVEISNLNKTIDNFNKVESLKGGM